MTEFLLFTLYAPMAAMGGLAVGEIRDGGNRPTRSGVFGVLAAALGIDRADEDTLAALPAGLDMAIRTDAPGTAMRDYHTAQTPQGKKARNFPTRRAELQAPKIGTILSERLYQMDSVFTIALWPHGDGAANDRTAIDLTELADALKHPVFTPYMGRKACPFAAPFDPEIVSAATLNDALDAYEPFAKLTDTVDREGKPQKPLRPPARLTVDRPVAVDAASRFAPVTDYRREIRRDRLVSRARWQFDDGADLVYIRPGAVT